jgi:histidine triad (HIT) family protein
MMVRRLPVAAYSQVRRRAHRRVLGLVVAPLRQLAGDTVGCVGGHSEEETKNMSDTIFGKIASGEIPADIVYEDEHVVAFRDLNPQAPTHVLVIPRKPIRTLNDAGDDDAELVGRLFLAAAKVAEQDGIAADGYRTVINCNAGAGQTVYHLHVHVLGGRPLQWPPG